MEIIVGKSAGFCYGVERAIKGAKKELDQNKKIYCLGEIVHNKNVIEKLKAEGIEFIDNIEQAKGKTIIRAHGISKEIYNVANEKGIEIQDLTCPSVLRIHNIAREYSENGYFIILTGKEEHPEVIGIKSYCGEKYAIVKDEIGLDNIICKINNEKLTDILLISQTTFSSKKFDNMQEKLKKNLEKNVNLVVKKTICSSTDIRQKETQQIAKDVDLMIIIGDKKSSNTTKLYEISCQYCKNVLFISGEKELDLKQLENKEKIGIMAGASTPIEDIKSVENKILGVIK